VITAEIIVKESASEYGIIIADQNKYNIWKR
jgi:hypothetical protein